MMIAYIVEIQNHRAISDLPDVANVRMRPGRTTKGFITGQKNCTRVGDCRVVQNDAMDSNFREKWPYFPRGWRHLCYTEKRAT